MPRRQWDDEKAPHRVGKRQRKRMHRELRHPSTHNRRRRKHGVPR